ncbi:hypothetical protein [Enterovirga aerilata]|uniref:Uncharacterized protein n=1 Tax=Enterovirga aerilata TaxID=2730920 RepID=A0A849I9T4_9HYPH|nr:hypothetical protein [Enterovirga sp. DB1703]NNM73169.1 hypothetical protein [Enterovirga sp. DB1703]
MSASFGKSKEAVARPPYKMIARRIGLQLREELEHPEAEPLPIDHVDLLLRLRQKERERSRRHA